MILLGSCPFLEQFLFSPDCILFQINILLSGCLPWFQPPKLRLVSSTSLPCNLLNFSPLLNATLSLVHYTQNPSDFIQHGVSWSQPPVTVKHRARYRLAHSIKRLLISLAFGHYDFASFLLFHLNDIPIDQLMDQSGCQLWISTRIRALWSWESWNQDLFVEGQQLVMMPNKHNVGSWNPFRWCGNRFCSPRWKPQNQTERNWRGGDSSRVHTVIRQFLSFWSYIWCPDSDYRAQVHHLPRL